MLSGQRQKSHKRNTEAVKLLLADPRVNPNKADNHGHTPLHYAAKKKYTGVVKELLMAGADPNIKDHEGHRPIEDLRI